MDIAALSYSYSLANTQTEVGTKVLAMAMDDSKVQGENMAAILESTVNPAVGQNIDYRV